MVGGVLILRTPKVFTPEQEKSKTGWHRYFIILIPILILTGAVVYFLFYSTYFKIKNIMVENSINPQIMTDLEKLKGENLLLVSSRQVESKLEQFSEVKEAKVMRGLPNTLKIRLKERESKIVWQSLGKKYLVDGSGIPFKEIRETTDLPEVIDNKNILINLGQPMVSDNFVNFVINAFINSPKALGFKINNFEINETIFQITAVSDQGWKVIFDTTRRLEDQISDLNKFLAEHRSEVTEYIDLRVEGRVYYK